MTNPHLLPLALLYVDRSRKIDGITRFQKLAFLAQKDGGLGELFEFEADKYGPFSKDLYSSIDALQGREMIKCETATTRGGNEKYVYSLTGLGQRAAKSQLAKDDNEIKGLFDIAQKIKTDHNDQPLDRLLRYVYKKYPDYTVNSELDIA